MTDPPITSTSRGFSVKPRQAALGKIELVQPSEGSVQKVLSDDFYRKNALKMKRAIAQAGGVSRAADIIEQALQPTNQCPEVASTKVFSSTVNLA